MLLLATIADVHWNGLKVVTNPARNPTKGTESWRLSGRWENICPRR